MSEVGAAETPAERRFVSLATAKRQTAAANIGRSGTGCRRDGSKTLANLTLNDDRSMPQLGMGTWQIKNVTAATIVRTGLDVGFQLVDTAAAYDNEMGVGDGIKGNDVWITTSFGTRGTVTLPRRWRKAWRCSGSTQWTYT